MPLMMTMLREAGIDSYPILVNSRDNGSVSPSFPSPGQFNHVILGIPVDDASGFAAVTNHPTLGKLLVFDPTDEQTPVGDLPWSDQGTRGLLVHPEQGALIDLPVLPAGDNLASRDWTLKLDSLGVASVKLQATFTGQYARTSRAWLGGKSDAQQAEEFTASLAARVPGARVDTILVSGLGTRGEPIQVDAELNVKRFSRPAGPMRLVEPLKFVWSLAPDLQEDPGGLPGMLHFRFQEVDRVHLELPVRWRVSEPPEDQSTDTPFGRLSLKFSGEEERWDAERNLVVDVVEVPVQEHASARSFFDEALGVLSMPLVLEHVRP